MWLRRPSIKKIRQLAIWRFAKPHYCQTSEALVHWLRCYSVPRWNWNVTKRKRATFRSYPDWAITRKRNDRYSKSTIAFSIWMWNWRAAISPRYFLVLFHRQKQKHPLIGKSISISFVVCRLINCATVSTHCCTEWMGMRKMNAFRPKTKWISW